MFYVQIKNPLIVKVKPLMRISYPIIIRCVHSIPFNIQQKITNKLKRQHMFELFCAWPSTHADNHTLAGQTSSSSGTQYEL